MDTVPAPIPHAAATAFARSAAEEEDVPLGWECANPALQIESWHVDGPGPAAAGLVSES